MTCTCDSAAYADAMIGWRWKHLPAEDYEREQRLALDAARDPKCPYHHSEG